LEQWQFVGLIFSHREEAPKSPWIETRRRYYFFFAARQAVLVVGCMGKRSPRKMQRRLKLSVQALVLLAGKSSR